MEGGGGGSGDDLGARRRLHSAPRGVTQQEKDLVGPAFAKRTGVDDKEGPVVGGTSGRSSTDDLDSDVGGQRRLRSTGGPQAGNLAKDIRVVSPIDPGKV